MNDVNVVMRPELQIYWSISGWNCVRCHDARAKNFAQVCCLSSVFVLQFVTRVEETCSLLAIFPVLFTSRHVLRMCTLDRFSWLKVSGKVLFEERGYKFRWIKVNVHQSSEFRWYRTFPKEWRMEMELLLACVSVLFAFVLCSFACTLHKNMDVCTSPN